MLRVAPSYRRNLVRGRQTQAVDAAGTTTFAYDAFGSLTNETVIGVAGTNTIERFSDAFGRDAGYALGHGRVRPDCHSKLPQ